jgi:RHS repeat-associated protein
MLSTMNRNSKLQAPNFINSGVPWNLEFVYWDLCCENNINENKTCMSIYYLLTDVQGSLNVVTNESGGIVEELSYDAYLSVRSPDYFRKEVSLSVWFFFRNEILYDSLHYIGTEADGRRRNASDWTYNNLPSSYTFEIGYTMHACPSVVPISFGQKRACTSCSVSEAKYWMSVHMRSGRRREHMDKFGLINMNGRVYNPILGRFLSADPIVNNSAGTQAFNRYSYCFNNPLMFTDPSGLTPPYLNRPLPYQDGGGGGGGEGPVWYDATWNWDRFTSFGGGGGGSYLQDYMTASNQYRYDYSSGWFVNGLGVPASQAKVLQSQLGSDIQHVNRSDFTSTLTGYGLPLYTYTPLTGLTYSDTNGYLWYSVETTTKLSTCIIAPDRRIGNNDNSGGANQAGIELPLVAALGASLGEALAALGVVVTRALGVVSLVFTVSGDTRLDNPVYGNRSKWRAETGTPFNFISPQQSNKDYFNSGPDVPDWLKWITWGAGGLAAGKAVRDNMPTPDIPQVPPTDQTPKVGPTPFYMWPR